MNVAETFQEANTPIYASIIYLVIIRHSIFPLDYSPLLWTTMHFWLSFAISISGITKKDCCDTSRIFLRLSATT